MKKTYDKPFAQIIDFSYEDQVVAFSGYYGGGVSNKDDTGVCQYQRACNTMFCPNGAQISTFSLTDCDVDGR